MTSNTIGSFTHVHTDEEGTATFKFPSTPGPRERTYIDKNGRKTTLIIVNNSGPGFKIPVTLDD